MRTEPEKASQLKGIGLRQHAALVGLLVERDVMISERALYVIGNEAPKPKRCLDVDAGILCVAVATRLGGDIAAAEMAVRSAIWRYMQLLGAQLEGRTPADIDLAVAMVIVRHWQANQNDWLVGALSGALRHLHPGQDLTPDAMGAIWVDAWQLYAGALSALGEATSRRVPADQYDYED